MNKELNIFTLRMLREQYEAEHLDTEAEALDAAIEALEIERLPTADIDTDSAYAEGWTAAESKYRAMMSDGDCISRQAAIHEIEEELKKDTVIDTRGTIREIGEYYRGLTLANAVISRLPSAQPDLQPTCNQLATDCISRQAAIDALCKSGCDSTYCGVSCPDVMAIENLPSAQPEIIRCKDCKHYEADIMANPWGVCCHDGWVDGNSGHEVSENGWCYRAERRTDETQNP